MYLGAVDNTRERTANRQVEGSMQCHTLPVARRSDDIEETRSTVLRLLELLSDREAQVQYEVDVPIANVPAELICMWFDDQYYPGRAPFTDAFSPDERAHLASFDATFAGVQESLPTSGGVAALHAAPGWSEVCDAAGAALEHLQRER